MITLYQFGPALGLMDPSPFVVKADLLLKLSGLPYRRERGDMRKAPKGKLPCIDDDGQMVPDSTLIRLHLADKHGITLDAGLSDEQKALAWSVDCMLGDHFYWGIVHERWMVDAYFERGPSVFFKGVPALLRGLVMALVRRKVRANLRGQGMGRFSAAERQRLLDADVAALSALLGEQRYFMGDAATWIDASVYAFVSSALTDAMGETPSRALVLARPNLVAYAERLRAEFYSG